MGHFDTQIPTFIEKDTMDTYNCVSISHRIFDWIRADIFIVSMVEFMWNRDCWVIVEGAETSVRGCLNRKRDT